MQSTMIKIGSSDEGLGRRIYLVSPDYNIIGCYQEEETIRQALRGKRKSVIIDRIHRLQKNRLGGYRNDLDSI